MRARRFRTQQDIERYVAQGFGQGVGVDYKPWLRVQDVPSRGRSRKVHGLKAGRIHHVLSDLEYRYLVALEFSERVIDIREQFPLLPVASVQDIALRRGIRYPLYAGTTMPFVMTTDFVVTVKSDDGTVSEFARTVKYADELAPSNRLARTLEKLELEKAFWAQRGVDWKLVTETSMSDVMASNLIWLRGCAEIAQELRDDTLQASFVGGIADAGTHDRTLSSLLRTVSYRLRMPYPDAVRLFRHLVWHKVLLVDLETPMKVTSPAPRIQIASDGLLHYKMAA
ncbi:heteromeric transposase endonuclease subunit TnsA [Paraburkholderia sp. Ac-20347]|nr:TnsA endonuclease N-terminal domain-containing protein [Paraburkholderia sp. Ac-20347]MBN3812795.1 heteromeric transposase endonuclease subunit TnsA [Paraburkholderia sp. Ac-20347]